MYLRCSRKNHIFITRIELIGKPKNDLEQDFASSYSDVWYLSLDCLSQ